MITLQKKSNIMKKRCKIVNRKIDLSALAYEFHSKEVDDCMDCKIARPACWLHAESRVRPSDIYIASLRF